MNWSGNNSVIWDTGWECAKAQKQCYKGVTRLGE
jgi:hypothetical protein